jgi:hypothetical protein
MLGATCAHHPSRKLFQSMCQLNAIMLCTSFGSTLPRTGPRILENIRSASAVGRKTVQASRTVYRTTTPSMLMAPSSEAFNRSHVGIRYSFSLFLITFESASSGGESIASARCSLTAFAQRAKQGWSNHGSNCSSTRCGKSHSFFVTSR